MNGFLTPNSLGALSTPGSPYMKPAPIYSPRWVHAILTYVNISANKPILNSVVDTSTVHLMFYFSVPKVFLWNETKIRRKYKKTQDLCLPDSITKDRLLLVLSESSLWPQISKMLTCSSVWWNGLNFPYKHNSVTGKLGNADMQSTLGTSPWSTALCVG